MKCLKGIFQTLEQPKKQSGIASNMIVNIKWIHKQYKINSKKDREREKKATYIKLTNRKHIEIWYT